ncbi:MAG: metal-binding protein [Oscillatoria sp. SIO1A7]|nr:metal-binding protein [Oscillatoria sp. SIO1A7]
MPSGRTHDRITLWTLPVVAGTSHIITGNSHFTLLIAGSFLFSGLMFGPDLDIYSLQFLRWGWLRYLWLPYQKSIRHRSLFSHGPIIGTALRVLYLATWIGMLAFLTLVAHRLIAGGSELSNLALNVALDMARSVKRSLLERYPEWLSLFIGMELGAMSHYLSDWLGSAYKRFAANKQTSNKERTSASKRTAKERQGKSQKSKVKSQK